MPSEQLRDSTGIRVASLQHLTMPGMCRAVLAVSVNGGVVAHPLSTDHTPFR